MSILVQSTPSSALVALGTKWLPTTPCYGGLVIHCPPNLGTRTPHSDQCINLDDFAQAIRRTGTATFELVLRVSAVTPSEIKQNKFSVEVDPNWLSRCRSLSLCPHKGYLNSYLETVDTILGPMDCGFPSLEKFSINELGPFPWDGALDMLISRVSDSSTNLRILELASQFESRGIELRVFQFPDILHRIRRLQLKSAACIPLVEFPNLEHLEYSVAYRSNPQTLSKLVAPRLTSLCLDLGFQNLPHAVFSQLTHMALRNLGSGPKGAVAFPLFPHLSFLGIEAGDIGKWLMCIHTEKPLEELILVLHRLPTLNFDLPSITLRPRVLRVDMTTPRIRCGFGEPFSLLSRVEEVHIIVDEMVDHGWFTSAVSRYAPSHPDCHPRLRVVTVLYSHYIQHPKEEKQQQVEELRGIQQGRRKSGLPLLETLKLGWYDDWDRILTVPYAEPPVMEWRDCLEGRTRELPWYKDLSYRSAPSAPSRHHGIVIHPNKPSINVSIRHRHLTIISIAMAVVASLLAVYAVILIPSHVPL